MTVAEERARKEALRTVLVRLSSGAPMARSGLFEGTSPLVQDKASWQCTVLRRMQAIGLIDKVENGNNRNTKWQLAPGGGNIEAYKKDSALTAILKPSPAVAKAEEEFEEDASDDLPPVAPAERLAKIAEVVQRRTNGSATVYADGSSAEVVEAPEVEEEEGEHSYSEVQAAIVKMEYANMQNLIYLRTKVDRLEKMLAELLAEWKGTK